MIYCAKLKKIFNSAIDKTRKKQYNTRVNETNPKRKEKQMNLNTLATLAHDFALAKRDEEAAKARKADIQARIIAELNGTDKVTALLNGVEITVSATYGKTRSSLDKSLIESVLGVKVTPECYKASAPWNEIRVKEIAVA